MKTPLLSLALVLGLASIGHSQETWKAGLGKATITPEQPMWMSGYGNRDKPAEGKETELWAKALVLDAGADRVLVFVSLDLVGVDRETSTAICRLLQEKYKLPREAICLACSHTHCGPVVGTNLRSMWALDEKQIQLIDAYTAFLVNRIDQAVGQAMSQRQPAKVSWGNGEAGFAVNRRENKEPEVPKLREEGKLKGPIDHAVMTLAVKDTNDKLLGVVFGYACHATVLGFYNWCGDYPGFAMMELEKNHPGAVALFFAGCGADQNPIPRRTIELAQAYGKQLADAVDRVLAKPMTALSPRLAMTYKEIALPLHELPTRDVLVQDSMNKDRFIANRAKMLLAKMAKDGTLASTYPYPVQTWKLGSELTWVTLGGEVVVDYSIRLKKELGPKTWVAGYANDVMAYIPSLRLKEGGYEGARSMIYYGLPSIWGTRVEDLIVNEVHSQAKE